MASFRTNRSTYRGMTGQLNFLTATLKWIYLKSSYAPLRTINVVADIVASECDVTGYSRQTLTGVTVTEDDTNHRAKFDANDPGSLTLGVGNVLRHVAIIEDLGSDATSIVHYVIDMGADKTTNGASFAPVLSPSGIGRDQN